MGAKLVSIAGPLKAAVFALGDGEVAVGRDPSNHVPVNDHAVSRRQCVVRRERDAYLVTDLGSHNGTFVNDVPVKERALNHGDRVRVGNSVFLFLLEESELSPEANGVLLEDTTPVTNTALRLQAGDDLALAAHDFGALMRASAAINAAEGMDALQRGLLNQLFQLVPAERGAILLLAEGGEEFASVFGLERGAGACALVRVSRTVVRQVVQGALGLMSNDVLRGEEVCASESLLASGVSSLLCVPLVLLGKVTGVVYLDARTPGARFNERHLRLATAVANVAAGALNAARRLKRLEDENRRLRTDLDTEHALIGESACMRKVHEFIAKVAPSDSTVLIRGESGTGKELVARDIHRNSPRASGPLVAVNCAALTETLLESELFGHEKGAFTGAYARKLGRLELADGGTIFLDEVGEMPTHVQTKLLRVLQEREFERVGGTRPLKVDIRVIAATNQDLDEAIRRGAFRRDLYYRLNVVSLTMPPLRERREDVALLSNYFVAKYGAKCKRQINGISEAARARLAAYDWPGNVRELENAVERAVVMGTTDTILAEDLPEALLEAEPPAGSPPVKYHEAVKAAKRQLVANALEQAGGDYGEAARLLGIHPNNLHRLIRNLGLRENFRK
ncbi:MAG TPA: sigma 54-interacting transcriptional regulator [Pyrinomonadaceae bacterium]|nr:sigma 54-interacting transcriptional regulator [Pyrinomonadaceae bacterium]